MVAGAIGEDGGIDHLAAGTTFPGVERPHEIVVLLGIHPALAFRAFHGATSWSMSELPFLAHDFSPGSITRAVPGKRKGAIPAPFRFPVFTISLLFMVT